MIICVSWNPVSEKSIARTLWKFMNLKDGRIKLVILLDMFRKDLLTGSTNEKLKGILFVNFGNSWKQGLILSLIRIFTDSSFSIVPGGILPITSTSVIFVYNAGSKWTLRKGFLNLIPVKSNVLRDLFLEIEFASDIRLPSSESSLFFETSR